MLHEHHQQVARDNVPSSSLAPLRSRTIHRDGSSMFESLTRRLKRLAAALLLCLFGMVPALGDTVLRVPVYHNAPLVDYADPAQPTGLFIDVLQSAASANGWKLRFVPTTFGDALNQVKEGTLDLMPDIALTPARQADYLFGQAPVIHTWGQIYARNDDVRSILDLAGKRVAGVAGTVQLSYFERTAAGFGVQPRILRARDYDAAVQLVLDGRADAVLMNPFGGAMLGRRAGLVDTAVMFDPFTEYFAGRRDLDAAIMRALDAHIAMLTSDPTSVYFASLRRMTEPQRALHLPPWFAWAVAAAGLLLSSVLGWSITLSVAARRIAASESLQRKTAAELQRISDHSLDVIAVVDTDLKVLRINPATMRLMGYAPEELQGRSCIDWVPAADRARAREVLEQVRSGIPQHSVAGQVVRRDGSIARMLWSIVWSERTREMYLIGHDDTERHDLISRLRSRGADLQTANADLRTFAQSVSHDLRSPVAAIVGFVGKVLTDHGDLLPPRSRHLLTRAHVASQRMDGIIANLLRLARFSELGLARRWCDVSALCEDVIVGLRNAEPERDVSVSIMPAMVAWADRDLLRHVLENVLSNAWKFSQYTPCATITVGCDLDQPEPVFFVRDNGEGFDMTFADSLFSPFTRLHDQSSYSGTGIGLSIAHRVVTGHGGRIWAESHPGQGATFRFTLGQNGPHLADPQRAVAPAPALAMH
jgi:PAS domain S-box-containing protein